MTAVTRPIIRMDKTKVKYPWNNPVQRSKEKHPYTLRSTGMSEALHQLFDEDIFICTLEILVDFTEKNIANSCKKAVFKNSH